MTPAHLPHWMLWAGLAIPAALMAWGTAEMALDSLDNGRHRKPS